MIKNKLKINYSKTEFIIFRSPLLKTDLSDVSISVGDSQISSSPKVHDLGVIFDNCLSLDAHVLRELHWLRISDRIIFKILILTHKAFHGVAPVYLCELITRYEQATVHTRLDQDCFLLAIPPISKTCAASFFEPSFLYAAPTL